MSDEREQLRQRLRVPCPDPTCGRHKRTGWRVWFSEWCCDCISAYRRELGEHCSEIYSQ
jgi:hypothetical protein